MVAPVIEVPVVAATLRAVAEGGRIGNLKCLGHFLRR
jgi:hypothetical protein